MMDREVEPREGEIFKSIPNYEGYDVSNQGRVRSYHRSAGRHGWIISEKPQRILKPSPDSGYLGVNIRSGGASFYLRVHMLVALTFLGECPPGKEICHWDGERSNNFLTNLRYDTHAGNAQDSVRTGAYQRGAVKRRMYRKFTEPEVVDIRTRRANKETIISLAKAYGRGRRTICNVSTHKTYKDFGGPKILPRERLTDDAIAAMRAERANTNASLREIGEKHGVTAGHVSRIVRDLVRVQH